MVTGWRSRAVAILLVVAGVGAWAWMLVAGWV